MTGTTDKSDKATVTGYMLPTSPWISGGDGKIATMWCESMKGFIVTNTLTNMILATQAGTAWTSVTTGSANIELIIGKGNLGYFNAAELITTDGTAKTSAIWSVRL